MTGDIYSYSHESEDWIPRGNIGLHHLKSAEEYNSLGKYVLQAPIYRPQEMKITDQLIYLNTDKENRSYIKKSYVSHFLYENCELEFKVYCNNTW